MKIKNSVGPKIDPWGTPDFIYAGVDSPLPLSITCWWPCRYDDGVCLYYKIKVRTLARV